MAQDMQAIGQGFIQRRKELNLSLKEVESATSIRTSYLEAIESGQMEKLISPIYAQGFVRQYAAFLGMDGDRIITENSEIFKKPIHQEFSYGIGTLETRGTPSGSGKWKPGALWVLAFGVLLLCAFLTARMLEVI